MFEHHLLWCTHGGKKITAGKDTVGVEELLMAIRMFEHQFTLAQKLGDPSGQAHCCYNLGTCWMESILRRPNRFVYMYMCKCVCMYMYLYICIYIYKYMYLCTYMYVYIHIQYVLDGVCGDQTSMYVYA